MVSGCMMRKTKKTGIEAENSPKENGDFMQLRSRRLYKSPDVSMEVPKKRQGNLNSASKGKGKGKDGPSLKRKSAAAAEEEEEEVVVEEEEDKLGENVEQVVKVEESVSCNEGGVGEFNVVVGPFGSGGGGGGSVDVQIDQLNVAVTPIHNLVTNHREIRESTPEHLIIRPDYIIATGSNIMAPRGNVATLGPFIPRRLQGGCVPSVKSIENLFAASELQQERLFMEKYNFDFKNESPLPGRYEWVKVEP